MEERGLILVLETSLFRHSDRIQQTNLRSGNTNSGFRYLTGPSVNSKEEWTVYGYRKHILLTQRSMKQRMEDEQEEEFEKKNKTQNTKENTHTNTRTHSGCEHYLHFVHHTHCTYCSFCNWAFPIVLARFVERGWWFCREQRSHGHHLQSTTKRAVAIVILRRSLLCSAKGITMTTATLPMAQWSTWRPHHRALSVVRNERHVSRVNAPQNPLRRVSSLETRRCYLTFAKRHWIDEKDERIEELIVIDKSKTLNFYIWSFQKQLNLTIDLLGNIHN